MQIEHINNLHVVQFNTDNGDFRRFDCTEWYKQEGTSWVLVEDISELEKEYQTICNEEPSLVGLED